MEFIDKTYALSSIKRFQNKNLDVNYNVAEHSFRLSRFVAITIMIHNEENPNNKLDEKVGTFKAMFHDDEESVSGDYPGHLKTPELRYQLRKQGRAIMKMILAGLPKKVSSYIYNLWLADKDGSEGEVVKVWDKLEGLITCVNEYYRANETMIPPLISHIVTLRGEEYQTLIKKFSYAEKAYIEYMGKLEKSVKDKEGLALEDFIEQNKHKAQPKFFKFYKEVEDEMAEEAENAA